MELNEGDVVLSVWVASLVPEVAGRPGDWMCVLVRRADGKLAGEGRFRYHAGSGFDADDEIYRTGFSAGDDAPEKRAAFGRAIESMFLTGGFANIQRKNINGDGKALMDALLEMPGWAVRMRREERAAKRGSADD